MLNEATSAYEHAVVAPLIVINGGAAIAYLTLLGARSKADAGLIVPVGWAVAALACWGLGLATAQVMISFGLAEQRTWSKMHRLKRQRVEQHLLRGDRELRDALYPDPDDSQEESDRLREVAKFTRSRGRDARTFSLACFALGIAFAVASIA
jgi:hypothetical protein